MSQDFQGFLASDLPVTLSVVILSWRQTGENFHYCFDTSREHSVCVLQYYFDKLSQQNIHGMTMMG